MIGSIIGSIVSTVGQYSKAGSANSFVQNAVSTILAVNLDRPATPATRQNRHC